VQSPHLFWPSDRKLFRQRSRLRGVVLVLALVVAAFLTVAVTGAGWH
jgi:hypothetical protein